MNDISIKKGYLKSIFVYFFLIISLVLVFYMLFQPSLELASPYKTNDINLAIQIIIRNMTNFVSYIALSPIMPIMYLLDVTTTAWSIFLSCYFYGLYATLLKLAPHGIFEIPNFCLYTWISYRLMREFYNKGEKKSYFKSIWNYRKLLIVNGALVFAAGLIEGLLT